MYVAIPLCLVKGWNGGKRGEMTGKGGGWAKWTERQKGQEREG